MRYQTHVSHGCSPLQRILRRRQGSQARVVDVRRLALPGASACSGLLYCADSHVWNIVYRSRIMQTPVSGVGRRASRVIKTEGGANLTQPDGGRNSAPYASKHQPHAHQEYIVRREEMGPRRVNTCGGVASRRTMEDGGTSVRWIRVCGDRLDSTGYLPPFS